MVGPNLVRCHHSNTLQNYDKSPTSGDENNKKALKKIMFF